MASTQEMIKARELAKQWVPLADAVKQVRTPQTGNAPVAWQAPAITPMPTTPTSVNVNEQQRMDNQANRQEMIAQGQVPAVWQTQAPAPQTVATQTTPTPTPITQAVWPTEAQINQAREVAKSTPTPEQLKNEEIKAKNEAQMALNKQQADLRDHERQKIDQETAQANTPKSASEMYNLISSKQPVPIDLQNTSAYRIANNRYQRVNQFVNMTPSEVNQAFTSGKLVEGSQAFEDLKSVNPKLAQDAINLRKVNGNKTNIFTYVNNPDGTKVKVNNLENQFVDQYSEDHPDIIELLKSTFNTPTYAEMQAQINTPEVKAAQEKATAIETEMNNLQTAMESVDKDVETELAWTGATGSRIALEKASRKQELQKQYDAKLRDYTTQYNKATSLINQNTEMFKYTQEQNKAMQTALSNVYMKQYESDLALKQNQAEFDQKIKQQAQAMNDPVMAISSMIEEYKKLNIPFTRSTQQIIQDFQTSGLDLPTYLSQLQGTIQSKPEYQRMQAIQQGQLSDMEKLQMQYTQQTAMQDRTFSQQLAMNDVNFNQDIQKMMAQYDLSQSSWVTEFKRDLIKWGMTSEQADAIVRNETGNWNWVSGSKLLFADDGTFIKSTLKTTTNPEWGIECAEYISKMIWSKVGNTWEEKVALNNESVWNIGSIAVWKPSDTGNFGKYWHAWVIVWEDGDNWVIKSANYNGDWRISTDTIPKSSIEWYRSTKLSEQLTTKKVELSPEQQRITANQEKTAFRSNPVVKEFEEMYSQNKNLVSSLAAWNAPWDMAAVFQFMKSLDPASVVRETEFALAAQATWLADRAASLYDKVVKWEKLTESQREEFGKLSAMYVKNKAESYNRVYGDMERTFNYFGLPKEVLPEKITVSAPTGNIVEITKETALDLYNQWKSNSK